jgi:hypothetical protein
MIVWTDYGHNAFPRQDSSRVTAAFGDARGADILAVLTLIEQQFWDRTEQERRAGHDENDSIREAALMLKRDYPFLTDEAIAAVEWCWGYGNR